mgnify:CR=1 FL=1
MSKFHVQPRTYACSLAAMALSCTAHAAEDFQIRYNIAGSLGGEMFAPPDQAGLAVGVAATYINITKVTGGDGKAITTNTPAGSVPLAVGGTPYDPTYAANKVQMKATGSMRIYNLAVGYVTNEHYGDGRLAFGVNVPYGTKKQLVSAAADTPALTWPSAGYPDATTKAYVGSQFASQYQSGIAAAAAGQTGDKTSLGDVELLGGWLYATGNLRMLVGASLVLPTGDYNADDNVNFATGKFYTFRPAVQVAYLPSPKWAVAGKVTMGFNTTNTDTDIRSGNWVGLEAATGYMTSVGVVGLHGVHVQQLQADSNNPLGSSKLQSTNVGAFFTTKVPGIEAALTAQTMMTIDSKNAKAGYFHQIRLIKVF